MRDLVIHETRRSPLRTRLKVFVRVQIKIKFGSVGFLGRENQSTRRKSSWRKGENQQQTQPTYCGDTRKGTQGVSLKRGVGRGPALGSVFFFSHNAVLGLGLTLTLTLT